jgi:phosphoribosyl-ATP pyrophosphohydrolase/phosphoribosyl-AMP cyclohydrolase
MIITLANMNTLDFSKGNGLLVAIAQHALSGEILMVAYMNLEALQQSLTCGEAVFFSRSRERLWHKGETSGNVLQIQDILADCDHDTLLLRVIPQGPACHTGARSCFLTHDATQASALALAPSFLAKLELIIDQRLSEVQPSGTDAAVATPSYTARLAAQGVRRIAQKVGEEGLEAALAGAAGNHGELRNESADLLFHLLVLLRYQGLSLNEILHTLATRHARQTSQSPGH